MPKSDHECLGLQCAICQVAGIILRVVRAHVRIDTDHDSGGTATVRLHHSGISAKVLSVEMATLALNTTG